MVHLGDGQKRGGDVQRSRLTPVDSIQPMRSEEAEEISRLIVASVREGLSTRYSPEVVEGLARGNGVEAVRNHGPKQTDYGLHSGDRIVAMIGLKRNEVGHLYVHPAHYRKGLGRTLVEFATKKFREAGYKDMMVMASLNAVDFYKRCGFTEQSHGSFKVGAGLDLEYVRMTCSIVEGDIENGGRPAGRPYFGDGMTWPQEEQRRGRFV